MRIITWNINSVRLRFDLVERLILEQQPDVLCLQEIKCLAEQFPTAAFQALGYTQVLIEGQKGYHGVATLSRRPLQPLPKVDLNGTGDARYLGCLVAGKRKRKPLIALHNVYVPAGGDLPDRIKNLKFGQKLDYLTGLADWSGGLASGLEVPSILVGDLNVAPLEHDVWSHRQLLTVVSHTPVEVEHFQRFMSAHRWHDSMRAKVPAEEKLYTWWSYRAADWRLSNRGRRLDHVLTSPELAGSGAKMTVLTDVRDWPKTSDHVPVVTDFDID